MMPGLSLQRTKQNKSYVESLKEKMFQSLIMSLRDDTNNTTKPFQYEDIVHFFSDLLFFARKLLKRDIGRILSNITYSVLLYDHWKGDPLSSQWK